MADLSTWLTKKQAAQRLGLSEKSVERHHQRGKLSMATLKLPGKVPMRVFKPEDVERLAAELVAQREALLAGHMATQEPQGNLPAIRTPVIHDLAAALSALADARKAPPVYVSLAEAAALAGLSHDTIRAAAAAGEIKTRPYGGGLRYRRADVLSL
jgi:hypothetical protein